MSRRSSPDFTQKGLFKGFGDNYEHIVGLAIEKYIMFGRMEKEIMELNRLLPDKVKPQTRRSDWSKPNGQSKKKKGKTSKRKGEAKLSKYDKILALLLRYAKIVQYGKRLFFGEIINNYLIMKMFIHVEEIIEGTKKSQRNGSDIVVEELSGGGNLNDALSALVLTLIVSLITVVTTDANKNSHVTKTFETGIFMNQEVISDIDISSGKLLKAKPAFVGDFDTSDMGHLQNFTREFEFPLEFKNDTIVRSRNINEIYRSGFIEAQRNELHQKEPVNMLAMSLTDSFMKDGQMKKELEEKFVRNFYGKIHEKLAEINVLVGKSYIALETMCESFIARTDIVLPIELFQIWNSEMAKEYEEGNLRQQKEDLTQQLKEELISEKVRIQEAEGEEINVEQVSREEEEGWSTFWSYMVPPTIFSSTTPQVNTTEIELANKKELVKSIKLEVEKELIEKKVDIERHVMNQTAQKIHYTMRDGATREKHKRNRERYLKAVCRFEPTQYIFNSTTGVIRIKNPASFRTHLMVLSQNVVSYYDTVLRGISYIDDKGEVQLDKPDHHRQAKMESLYEKAKAIIPILDDFDVQIKTSIFGKPADTVPMDQFFASITTGWNNMNDKIFDASEEYPITAQEERLKMKELRERHERAMARNKEQHLMDMQSRVSAYEQNMESANITRAEYVAMKDVIHAHTSGIINIGATVINDGVEGVSTVSQNVLTKIGEHIDSISIMIMKALIPGCMLLFGGFLTLFICSGIGRRASVNWIARRIDPTPPPPPQRDAPVLALPPSEDAPGRAPVLALPPPPPNDDSSRRSANRHHRDSSRSSRSPRHGSSHGSRRKYSRSPSSESSHRSRRESSRSSKPKSSRRTRRSSDNRSYKDESSSSLRLMPQDRQLPENRHWSSSDSSKSASPKQGSSRRGSRRR
jgi:hypothetical protein